MTCEVFVDRVSDVQPHPASDNLDVVTIAGKTNVANRPAPNTPRYKIGDYAVVLTENLILPDNLIQHLDMWDSAKNKGVLAGSKGNRTKARNIAGIASEVALCRAEWIPHHLVDSENQFGALVIEVGENRIVRHLSAPPIDMAGELTPIGQEVSEVLGITEYIPK